MPKQRLMGKGLVDLARHPVVGEDHALGHCLVNLEGLARDQSRDIFFIVQLCTHLVAK